MTESKSQNSADRRRGFATSPFVMSWAGLLDSGKAAVNRIIASEASLRCAGVAFYAFLSIFPAMAAAVIVFGLFLDRSILDQILAQTAPLLPEGPERLLNEQLTRLSEAENQGLGIGLVVTLGIALWSGSRGVNALIFALTRAYHEEDERSFLMGAALSLFLTIASFVVAFLTVTTVAVLPIAFALVPLPADTEWLASLLRWPLLGILILFAVVGLFRVAPNREPARMRWIFPGAFVSTALWLLASFLFSIYVENFGSYDVTFGSLSAVIVLLLWIYYSAMIFVFGACLNAELEMRTRKDTTTGAPRPMGERGAVVADNFAE